jgi:DNA-binding transcriptional MerR regulator
VRGTLLISELAARSGFSASTLRYYEQVGLLTAAERSSGGYRLYDEAALSRLRFIARAKQLGLPLEEIRELVAVWDGGLCAHVQERLRTHIAAKSAEVRSRIGELEVFAGQLDAARAALAEPAADGPCGDGCGCAEPADDAGPPTPRLLELSPTRRGQTGGRSRASEPASVATETVLAAPVACTLDAGERPARLAAWSELLAIARDRELIDGGVRLRFPLEPELAGRLAELAAREQACCSFFTFTLQPSTAAVTLDVRAPAEAAGAVTEMFEASA